MKIVALTGGVGGAKLAHGLAQILPPEDLTIIVNTGDDFEYLGLKISPDLDTVCYTLAGLANPTTGWGLAGETWSVLSAVVELGGPGWFKLGDRDLATHLERTRRLKESQPLSLILRDFCQSWGIKQLILPMSDQRVRTMVDTVEHGSLEFQEYFVKLDCQPRVTGFQYLGAEEAFPAPGVIDRIHQAGAVIICPSNPWVSIAPILAVEGIKTSLKEKQVIAVSPIIAGAAVKGPTAKMYRELGWQPSALSVAQHYSGLVKGFVIDNKDAAIEADIKRLGMEVLITRTLMDSIASRRQLAQDVLNFIGTIL